MSALAWLALLGPVAVVVYALFVRPVLAALPVFKKLYANADGFWQTAWALCGKSTTLAVSYAVQAVGWAFQAIDPVAELLNDPDLKQTIADTLQASPTTLGRVMSLISIVIIAARVRSLFKKVD
jgi:hypothetical protein